MVRPSLDEIFGNEQGKQERPSLSEIFGDQPTKTQNPLENMTAEQKAQIAQRNADYAKLYRDYGNTGANMMNYAFRSPSRALGVLGSGLEGFGEGVEVGTERALNGATLGGYDWVDRNYLGGQAQARNEALRQRAEDAGVGGYYTVAELASEIGGAGAGAGGAITKGLMKAGAKGLGLALGDAAIQSGIMGATSTDNIADLPINIAANVSVGTVFGGGLYGGAKLLGYVSSLLRSNTKRGMDYLRSKLGDEAADAMIKEAQNSGRSLAEVADDKALRAIQMARQNTEDAADIVSGNARKIEAASGDKSRALIDETLGNRGGFETVQELEAQAKKEAAPLWEELNKKGDLAAYETKDIPEQNFKRWFEGSKVVDENGQPRRYYHGSLRNFDEFKQANNDYNFAPDKKFAYNYAESKGFEQGIDAEPQLYEVFLNSKKPFDFENPEDIKNLSNYIKGKKIRVFGNPKKEEEFLRNLKGEYYDTKLDEGEFEKLLSDKYNKWYSPDNHDVNYEQSSVNTDKIFSVNPDEEYFITGSAPWGYNIDDVKSSQIEDAIKNLDFGKNKRHQIPVDIETPYGNRVINIDLKRIDKPSAKNLKRGADNWIDIESADFDGEDLLDALKNMGYDGYYKQENGVKNLSVFNPNQIKSVNNSGAWSSSPSLSDAGWKPESKLANYVKENDLIQREIGKIRKDATLSREVREAADTDFRVLQAVKENIDDQISVAKRQGEDKLVRRLVEQKNELLNRMDEVAPEYKQARQIYEDEKQFERAVKLSEDVFDTKISAPKFAANTKGLSQNEKQALKLGLRDELYRIIGNAQNEALGWKKVVPENVQAKIRNVLGQTEGDKLINWANREIVRMRNFNKLLQGSQTAEKTALQIGKEILSKPVELATNWANRGRNIGIADITTRPSANLARETYNQLVAPQGWETIYQALNNPRGVTALNSAMAAYLANAGLK